MSQDAPRNASELIGKCDGEDVVMQPLPGAFAEGVISSVELIVQPDGKDAASEMRE